MKKKTREEVYNAIKESTNGEYELLGDYINSSIHILVRHNKCGNEWKTLYMNLLKGHGCPKCGKSKSGKKRKTDLEFKQQLMEKFGEKTIALEEYETDKTKIKFRCNVCNKDFISTPNAIFNSMGCPHCAEMSRRKKRLKYSDKEFRDEVKRLTGEEYSLLSEYKTLETKVFMKHNKCGHEYFVRPVKFINGQRCPNCRGKRIAKSKRKSQEDFEKQVMTMFQEEYTVVGEYKNAVTKIKIKHNKCGNLWDVAAGSFLLGHGCPRCNSSKGEKIIEQYLKEQGIDYIPQYVFKDCRNILPLKFDFAVFENDKINFLIEYQGEQHYKPVDCFGGEHEFKKVVARDVIKQKYCKEKGLDLFLISYQQDIKHQLDSKFKSR